MGSYVVSTVFSSRTANQQPQSVSGAFLVAKGKSGGSCRAQGPARVGIVQSSNIPMMSDYEDDLDDFPVEKETKRPNLRLEHIAQSRQINGQHELGSLQKFHHFLMSQLLFQVG